MKERYSLVLYAIMVIVLSGVSPVIGGSEPDFSVEPAEEWSALFDRDSGWVGADGAYSIPLSGSEAYEPQDTEKRTLFLFGDTFVGEVKENGERTSGTAMVNNTAAMLRGSAPRPRRIRFYHHTGEDGEPGALFVPSASETGSEGWYWPMDGAVVGDTIYIFASRIRPAEVSSDAFNFAQDGVVLLQSDVGDVTKFRSYRQTETPLYDEREGEEGDVVFGGAVMVNTEKAGSPDPDGFVYVYGLRNAPFNKKLLAARVRPEGLADFGRWRFWDGEGWSTSIKDAAPLAERLSAGFSVSPLPDGRFVCVFQLDGIGEHVALRVGESPVGPFGSAHKVWSFAAEDIEAEIFCYNAKAHPHLSRPGELLISHNVNAFDFGAHFRNADIYRPRFIRVGLPGKGD